MSTDRIIFTGTNIKVCFRTQITYGDHKVKALGASFLKSEEALCPLSLRAALRNFEKGTFGCTALGGAWERNHTNEGFY